MGIKGFNTNNSILKYEYNSLQDIPQNLAQPYSTSATYAVGDYCTYNNVLYKCTTVISTAESWTSGHWSEVKLTDDVGDLKSDLNEINSHIYYEEYEKIIDGYDANNSVNLSPSNAPFVLSDDVFGYSGSIVQKIILKVFDTGTLSIGTIKKVKVVENTTFDRSDVDIKERISILSSGTQEVVLQNEFMVDSDEFITIGFPTDTCTFMYGNGSDKGFMIANSSTSKWEHFDFSLGITIYAYTSRKYIDDELNDVKNNLNDLESEQVKKSQGVINAGKYLVVGNDGNVTLGDGFLDAKIIEAFTELLQHFVYTDDGSSDYYFKIVSALNGDEYKSITDISVYYDSTGHTVAKNDDLSSIRPYLTVTAIYNDGSYKAISSYVLTGKLDVEESVINVRYFNIIKQITVDVDTSLIYDLPSQMDVLSGSDITTIDYIPTIGETFGMFIKTTLNGKDNDNARILINNYEEVSTNNYVGLQILIMTINGVRQLKPMFGGNESIYANFNDSSTKELDFAMTYDADQNIFTSIVYENGIQIIKKSVTITNTHVNTTELYVGGGGVNWVPYKGTIKEFKIWNRVLTESEMIAMLEGGE